MTHAQAHEIIEHLHVIVALLTFIAGQIFFRSFLK